jgi:tol-pal system protein YbgF
MFNSSLQSISNHRRSPRVAGLILGAVVALVCFTAPAFAVNKEMVQLQTQIQQLQDAVARLQQSNDERMGVMKDLVQQSADAVNRMSVNVDTLHKQIQAQQETQTGKIDQVSGQIQSLNDTLDELKTRLARLEKLTQDVQSQQQSMSANLQNLPQSTSTIATAPVMAVQPPVQQLPPVQAPAPGKKGKPSAALLPVPTLPSTSTPQDTAFAAPPVDELYKTALGDYMSAKYALAATEFGDVIKFYPESPLSGNAFYYHAEIDYRAGKYAAAIKDYDKVIEQYPDNNKVPVSHLHKGQALIGIKQNEAGVRELRALIQRFPNSPEALSARSRLNGMGVPITPRRSTVQ